MLRVVEYCRVYSCVLKNVIKKKKKKKKVEKDYAKMRDAMTQSIKFSDDSEFAFPVTDLRIKLFSETRIRHLLKKKKNHQYSYRIKNLIHFAQKTFL